jgi:protein subunit release factor B
MGVMEIRESDLVVEFYRGSGPGGQHRNVTETAVRIRHIPTGIVVTASESRSQARNREVALERLRQALVKRARKPKRRLPTAPTKSSVERRLTEKRLQSQKKLRRSTDE